MTNFDKYFDGDWFKVVEYVSARYGSTDCENCPFAGKNCSFLKCDENLKTIFDFEKWLGQEFIELKPCPFCGSSHFSTINDEHDEWEDWMDDSGYRVAVCCNLLRGGCGASSGYFDTVEEAVRAWNRRDG